MVARFRGLVGHTFVDRSIIVSTVTHHVNTLVNGNEDQSPFSSKEVGGRLWEAVESVGSAEAVAEMLRERTGYVTSGQKIREACNGRRDKIDHALIAAVVVACGGDPLYILTGERPPEPEKQERPASLEPIGNAERLQLVRLATTLTYAIAGMENDALAADRRVTLSPDSASTERANRAGKVARETERREAEAGSERASGPTGPTRDAVSDTNHPPDHT